MGIHGLAKLIADQAPGAIKEQDIKNYFGQHYSCRLIIYFVFKIVMIYFSLNLLWCKWTAYFMIFFPGRKIAIDASMCMYQFLIAVRQDGNVLQNEDGETTRSVHF